MLTTLPRDILIHICLLSRVEDVLNLMRTCRVMHAVGSLDYLWHNLLSDWDILLDIPVGAPFTSFSGRFLREAAVKALKLDSKWRDPNVQMRRAQRIIESRSSSFVDAIRLLPGGSWLVAVEYEKTGGGRTHLTLWSTEDLSNCHSIFKINVLGRVRGLHAYHNHALGKIMIVFTFASDLMNESIRVYNVSLQADSATHHSLLFEATPRELDNMGQIAVVATNGEVMFVAFAPPMGHDGQIMCVNLASRATVVLKCPDWSFAWQRLKVFSRHFAVINTPLHATIRIAFYDVPSAVLNNPSHSSSPAPCWPKKLVIKSSLLTSTQTSWTSEHPHFFQLSPNVPTRSAEACCFTLFGLPLGSRGLDMTNLTFLRVSFDGKRIECTSTAVPCPSRFIPCVGGVRVSPSGRRAVWCHVKPDAHERVLMKYSLRRGGGNETEPCISTLMPSFSGLPLNPVDFHVYVFDDISCRMAVSSPSGELYLLHF